MDCSKYRQFWISWKNGHLKLGGGIYLDKYILADWIDQRPFTVNAIGLMTKHGSVGDWKIFDVAGTFVGHFSTCNTKDIRAVETILLATVVRSRLQCTDKCSTLAECTGFNYNANTKECELISSSYDFKLSTSNESNFYRKCFPSSCGSCPACLL
ncbi:Hypothetical predicted protein [Mytilus galloprovincialis]|uniref:Apple domain-containing protein n=1 Tax=Mytilus galloprovincialis TaxID=29158 RepID=A0A8B6HFD4_MYTGA|nr:Hypothetical predicted protein [Mytilus galloprovincialis]